MFHLRKFYIKLLHLNNTVLFFSSIMLIVISTIVMAAIEPKRFPSLFDSFWWVMTTVTTVGYGDYYPISIAGRIYAIFLYIVGIGLIGVVIGKILDSFGLIRKMREEGKVDYKGKNHIIIIGWSKKAEYAIDEILRTDLQIEVVLIDLLKKTPIAKDRLHYIYGSASDQEVLKRANITESKAVILFADGTIEDTQLADGKSLLIASAVERMAPDVHTTVEILNEEHIHNFRHVKVDEFVFTHETISRIAVRSAFTKGVSNVYSQLMSRGMGEDLFQISPKPNWVTYRDAFNELLSQGATLIADGQRLDINRRLDEPIQENALLYIICDKETYESITS